MSEAQARTEPRAPAPWARGVRVAPSILAADAARLGEEVRAAAEGGADWVHIDAMDGHFVPNLSFGPQVVAALRAHTTLYLDVHLMVIPSEALVTAFAKAGADGITVHAEATPHLHRTLGQIRELGCRAGVALNPATPVDALAHVLELTDLVNVMCVNPGFGGQAFIAPMLDKIAVLDGMIAGRPILIEADGGVAPATAPRLRQAGVDVLAAGSAVFGAADYGEALRQIRG